MADTALLIKELEMLAMATKTEIERISRRIRNVPSGSLRISKRKNKYQYFHRINPNDFNGTYIPRKDHDIVVRLAQKDYDTKLLAELEKQLKAIERFLNTFDPEAVKNTYEKLSEPRKALIDKGFLTDEEFIKQWLDKPYRNLGFKKEAPEFYTHKGERVRSKSEILIADALLRHNIPYRYEYPVIVNGIPIGAPDFNCLNVRLRQDYYWEHLGMLGNREYEERNVKKLEKYTLSKEFDESKLILTFETESHPLNTKVIEEKIRRYLI